MEVIGQETSQAGLLKNIVPDPEWFDGDQTKFEDQWREIYLFLKSNRVVAEWKIETFKQGKKYIADFMIEFEVLAMKTDTDDLHAIFLLKKNV